jgi:hypothetical protein
MAERVKNLYLTAAISIGNGTFMRGKLFLGVLGFEYSIPSTEFTGVLHPFNLSTSPEPGKPLVTALQYTFYNRTAAQDEFAFSDGILPAYLRFQPDLLEPLDKAAAGVPCGADYMQQSITITNPIVQIEGKEQRILPNGATEYKDVTVELTLPINPPAARVVTLGVESGLMCFLGKAR